ncbi:DC-STAMP domain-containing protein 2-like [Pectinophora gossypiella]|uniref:DC-STAMP domain-containing protein 2-like n=1 Tax=Pectinophora gossypiella TaxID=13191 RepID=UPI00214F2CBB|nr:DC-STAMP domain-containing protein 2-like [Pectinophora gossypiella]
MAYLALLWKARTIEKYRLNYEKEKLNSIRINNAQNPKKTLYQKWCHINLNTKKRLSKAFLRYYPKGSKVYNFFYYLRTDQTFPNFVLKSVIGFVGGIIMTYLCFMFFVFQLSISLIYATIMSSIIGVLLTLGLAFSYRVRCLVFLLIPQFFSRVGRYTLTCYVLVLILTGPATNTLKNSEVLSESLACGQEQVKTSMRQINDCVKKPFNSMKDNIRLIVDSVKLLAKKLKHMVVVLNRMVMSLAASLQSSFAWLNSAAECCNRRLGTPYDRCQKAIGESLWGCQAYLGPDYSWLCSVAKVANAVCWPVQPMKGFCYVIEYANNNVLGVVSKNLKKFSDRINSILQVDVQFHHSYSLSSNASRSASQVAAGIVTEIRNRADPLLTWLSWSSCVTSLSLLLIIFRAKHYQHMFETRSRFDNRYVTKELRDLDLKRLRQGKATVLPLNRREDGKYIKTTSFRLVSSEKVHLSRSVVTMIITTFKLMIHMVADYSLYWVLMTIRYHGRFQTPTPPGVPNAGVYVSGSGLISKILRSLVGSISLPLDSHLPSPVTCLPNPSPPDFQRYIQIGILIFLLWFFALFEPYGLRLRHVIMGLYSPERAKARAVWLYNHIQRTRGCFMKFARRKLHRQYKYLTEEQYTIRRWLNSHIPCGTPSCPGTFCRKCFSDIGEMCTICMSPADYGDMSDVSLEKDSSDEDDIDEGEDDDGDDDDDDPFPGDSSLADDNLDHSFATDFDDGFIPRNDVTRKRKWFFFPKENRDSDLEKGTSKQDIHDDHDKETAQELPSLKNISKALIARHRKYSKLDFEDERRKQKEEGITKIISDEDIEMVVPKLQELRSPKGLQSIF